MIAAKKTPAKSPGSDPMSETLNKQAQSSFALNPQDELNDLRMSEKALPLLNHVKRFIAEVVEPMSEKFHALDEGKTDIWSYAPGQLELLEAAKDQAKKEGLWNFFLPNAETGEGLSNLDYAYIAVELGKNRMASECMNCAAPDTGNMEVLERVGTPAQKKQWLEPLLRGEIRSAFAMTEVNAASSDAKNINTRATLVGDEYVINGEKYYISGAGDPRCKIMITMVQTSPDGPANHRQSQILVPMDTPGVEVLGPMCVFGNPDAPHGHMQHHLRQRPRCRRQRTCCWAKAAGSRSASCAWSPAGSTTACAPSSSAEKALDLLVSRGPDPRSLRQAARATGRQPGDHQPRPHRHRGHAPDGAEGRQGHGRPGQPGSPRLDPHGQGDGAGKGLPDHLTKRSRCTARWASARRPRWPGCTPRPAPCGSPTARTRFTTWWSAATSNCCQYREMPQDASTAAVFRN